ncbi:hypothetical protein D7M10_01515 [Pseudomonas fluorescens]|nr:hypothetical protein D7M10_01515 [Pseudomonas fluorescens]
MGDAGADSPPWQPASQESKLHASAPTWVFCLKIAPIKVQIEKTAKIAHCNVAQLPVNAPVWCMVCRLYINWSNLERFPL